MPCHQLSKLRTSCNEWFGSTSTESDTFNINQILLDSTQKTSKECSDITKDFEFSSERNELVIPCSRLPPSNAQDSSLPDVVRGDRSESSGHGCNIKSGNLVSHTSSGYESAQKPIKCYSIYTNNSPEHGSCDEDNGEISQQAPQQSPQQAPQQECTIEGRIHEHSEIYSQESGNETRPINQHSCRDREEGQDLCTSLLDGNHHRRDDLVTPVSSTWESGICTNTHPVSDPTGRDENTLPLHHQETQHGEDHVMKEGGSVLLNPAKSLQEGSNEQESEQEGQGDPIEEETQRSSSRSSIDSLRSKNGNFHTEGHNHDCSQDGRNGAVCEHKLSVDHTPEESMVSVTEGARLSRDPVQQSQTDSVTELLVPQPQSMPSDDKGLLVPPPWQVLPLSIRKNVVLPPLVLPSFMNSSYQVLPSSSTPVPKGVVVSQMPSKSVPKSLRSGYILYSAIFKVFEEGTYLPVPSQEAMKKSIGKGGNGVITNIYHKGMEFAAKKGRKIVKGQQSS